MNRLDRIKQAQLEEAAKTGINPYAEVVGIGLTDAAAVSIVGDGTLADYQLALEIDLGKVSAQPSVDEKNRVKKAVLPTYLNFVKKYIESGDNYPNDVAVQVLIWLLDTNDIELGLNLAAVLVRQKQRMPAKFDRNIQTFVCDEFYDWANAMLEAGHGVSPYLDVLLATIEQDEWDVHPLCISKLCVILAKYKEIIGQYEVSLALCQKAERVNPEKAGVKKMIERLQKQLTQK